MKKIQICFVLNAHLPFVRHPEYPVFLEERWLFEALSETYLPLLRVFHKLEEDGIPFRLSMSFSPTLTAMLTDPVLQERYKNYLDLQLELAEKELIRTESDPLQNKTAKMYRRLYKHNQGDFNEVYQGNILRGFTYFQKKGHLEILTSAATHPFLPLYQATPEVLHAQIQLALESHHRNFSRLPRGIWLPECAYYPGMEEILKRYKLDYFFVASHAALYGNKFPKYGVFSPLTLPNTVMAFPRDMMSTNAIWSHDDGYPSDPVYREFYRDIGFDLPLDYVKPYMPGSDNRIFTGFKYYSITGHTDQKKLYDPALALQQVENHARAFLNDRYEHAKKLANLGFDRTPVANCPLNAELFGHWWFEGPQWVDSLFRNAIEFPEIGFSTPSDILLDYPDFPEVKIPFSSWATGGYAEIWVDGKNDWLLRHTQKISDRMIELVDRFPDVQGRKERALNQAAREVLLAQSSDWPLILKMGTAVGYAERRVKEHISNFNKIFESLSSNTMDTEWLMSLEKRNNIFPFIDYRIFKRISASNSFSRIAEKSLS